MTSGDPMYPTRRSDSYEDSPLRTAGGLAATDDVQIYT